MKQYEFYVTTKTWNPRAHPVPQARPKGWVCNPIAGDEVTAFRVREVTEWQTTQLKPDERLPRQVMRDVGLLYEDGVYGDMVDTSYSGGALLA